eukprot:CAMPEP_0114348742 /NCGR_PEP_ID=MMETSP0101-20121206/14949_1 /TAXON_ID=38822 ORGANISM="Pteridomonas danica, Strain PT" /NCGR_SAMPLE_ID=MMETSP0101 /ASSEMBLY_ACC=CAM_ASM_000211 /LENGTH=79 /DNA_ID=CAMNT_0001486845 /DNA_START=85 /DNA_END=324 /DNA_ORIENTATION=-
MPFKSERDAEIVVNTLRVDEVLSPKKVNQTITNDGHTVTFVINAVDERTLRLCVSGLMDMAMLVSQTLDEFSTEESTKI